MTIRDFWKRDCYHEKVLISVICKIPPLCPVKNVGKDKLIRGDLGVPRHCYTPRLLRSHPSQEGNTSLQPFFEGNTPRPLCVHPSQEGQLIGCYLLLFG